MSTEARHHHFIPQAYLQGFATQRGKGQKKQWFTFVSDFREKRSYDTNVRNVCGERDFMRFEVGGHPPTKLEHELGHFEGKACAAIRRVVETGKFEGEDKIIVLNLMALLAVRHPERRENFRDFEERVAKKVMSAALSKKEYWESEMARLSDKTGKTYDTSYEEVKARHDRGGFRIEVPRERLIGTELMLLDTVLELLFKRKWTLYTTTGEHEHFITTNNPVVLSFLEPEKVPEHMRYSPGHGLPNTEVCFPLTKHGFLVGRWDRGGHTEAAKPTFVAIRNRHMIWHAFGQAFSDKKKVPYYSPTLDLCKDDKLVENFMTEPTLENED